MASFQKSFASLMLAAAVCGLTTLLSTAANGDIYYWHGGDGRWLDPLHWNPSFVPGEFDHAWIDAAENVVVTVDAPTMVGNMTLAGGRLTLGDSGGMIGELDVVGALFWQGGAMVCEAAGPPGDPPPPVFARAELSIEGSGSKYLGLTLICAAPPGGAPGATANWSGGDVLQATSGGTKLAARFETLDAMTISCNASWIADYRSGDAEAVFLNAGTLEKTSGGTTVIGCRFENDGAVHVRAGTLRLLGGGGLGMPGSSAQYVGHSGTLIEFGGGHEISATASVSADFVAFSDPNGWNIPSVVVGSYQATGGTAVRDGGTVQFLADAVIYGLGAEVDVRQGGMSIAGTGSLTTDNLVVGDGGLLATSRNLATTDGRLSAGGEIDGGGAIVVNGAFDWTGGTLSGAGSTAVAGTLQIGGDDEKHWNGRPIDVPANGRVVVQGAGRIAALQSSGVWQIASGGVVDLQSDADLLNESGAAPPTARNEGLFKKTAGDGTSDIEATFNNLGTVEVNSGTLRLARGGTHSGRFIGSGTLAFDADPAYGEKHVLLHEGRIEGPATVIFDEGCTTDVYGTFNSFGTSAVRQGARLNLLSGSSFFLNGALTLDGGTVNVQGGASFKLGNGPLLYSGNLNFLAGSVLELPKTMTVRGAAVSLGDANLINKPDDWIVQGGQLTLDMASSVDLGGSIDVREGASLYIQQSPTVELFEFSNQGTTSFRGAASPTLDVTGLSTIRGRLTYHGGPNDGTAALTARGGIDFGASGNVYIQGWRLDNLGTAAIGATTVWLSGGTAIYNEPGARLELVQGSHFGLQFGGTAPCVVNKGLVIKTGSGIAQFDCIFQNRAGATVRVDGGSIDFHGAYQDQGGAVELNTNGNVTFFEPTTLETGSIYGVGGVHGGLTQAGGSIAVSPGAAGGTIECFGPFNQTGGVLDLELSGPAAGDPIARTHYDTFELLPQTAGGSALATLGGMVRVSVMDYDPKRGTTYDIVASTTGVTLGETFQLSAPALGDGKIFKHFVTTLGDGRSALRLKVDYNGHTPEVYGGLWNDPATWGPDDEGIPGPDSNVYIPCGSDMLTVIPSLFGAQVNSITIGGNCTSGFHSTLQLDLTQLQLQVMTILGQGQLISPIGGSINSPGAILENLGLISGNFGTIELSTLTNLAGGTLNVNADHFSADIVNHGGIDLNSVNQLFGDIANMLGGAANVSAPSMLGNVLNKDGLQLYLDQLAGRIENEGALSGRIRDILSPEAAILNSGIWSLSADAIHADVVNTLGGFNLAPFTVGGTPIIYGDYSGTSLGGVLSLGFSPGEGIIDGNYTECGTLEIELGGPTAGTEYDRLTVNQTAAIDGTIQVLLIDLADLEGNSNPFAPALGDYFDVLLAAQIDLAGATLDLPSLDGDLQWSYAVVDYGSGYESLRLTVVPEPGSLALALAAAVCFAAIAFRRWRATMIVSVN